MFSGEYAMIKAAAEDGWIMTAPMMEQLMCIKRWCEFNFDLFRKGSRCDFK
jgi:delta-aminolevulinic acid dehydratase/porphobilinogen synthase